MTDIREHVQHGAGGTCEDPRLQWYYQVVGAVWYGIVRLLQPQTKRLALLYL